MNCTDFFLYRNLTIYNSFDSIVTGTITTELLMTPFLTFNYTIQPIGYLTFSEPISALIILVKITAFVKDLQCVPLDYPNGDE